MKGLISKIDKKAFMLGAGIISLFAFVTAILNVSLLKTNGLGDFFNCIVLCFIFGLLVLLLNKDDKEKLVLLFTILVGAYVITGFGGAINNIVTSSDAASGGSGSFVAYYVFLGLTLLSLFLAAVFHFITKFINTSAKDTIDVVSSILFFVGGLFAFVSAIIGACIEVPADYKATLFFNNFLAFMEAMFFGCLKIKLGE